MPAIENVSCWVFASNKHEWIGFELYLAALGYFTSINTHG